MLFSSQQQVDFASFADTTFAAYLLSDNRDFGCIQLIDDDGILPYSTLELIFMEAGSSMPAPTPYTWPIQVVPATDAAGMAVAFAAQLNLWIKYFRAYPGFASMKAKVVDRNGSPFVRLLMPWGMLGLATAFGELPSQIIRTEAIGQNVPLIPTIRGRNLGLLPVTPIDTGYYYGDNPYEYYSYDYIEPRT